MNYQAFDHYDEIRLISENEWENIVSSVPNVPVQAVYSWWVSDKAHDPGNALFVSSSNGEVWQCSEDVLKGVRPLFGVIVPFNVELGEKVWIRGVLCTVVDICDRDEFYALADSSLILTERENLEDFLCDKEFENQVFKNN